VNLPALLWVWMTLFGFASLLVSLTTVERALSAGWLVESDVYLIPSLTDLKQEKKRMILIYLTTKPALNFLCRCFIAFEILDELCIMHI